MYNNMYKQRQAYLNAIELYKILKNYQDGLGLKSIKITTANNAQNGYLKDDMI